MPSLVVPPSEMTPLRPSSARSIRASGDLLGHQSSLVPLTPAPVPHLTVPDDVRDRLDDATWIGRVRPGFSHLADVAPVGPDADTRFSLFRFEVRVGDRVRFRLRAGLPAAGGGAAAKPATLPGVARLRLFGSQGETLAEGQSVDAALAWPRGGPAECKLKYTFHHPGAYHLAAWTAHSGRAEAAAPSPCLLRVSYARLDLPDLVATAVAWDKDTHGLRVEYEVADDDRSRPRPAAWGPGVAVYWVDWGLRRLGRVRHPATDRHNADTRLTPGPHTLLVPRAAFPKPPADATGVEVCLNADRTVPERDPTNNTKFTGLSLGRRRPRPAGG